MQMNSISSSSGMIRWLTRTVHGFVYAFGSSTVTSISQRAVGQAAEPLGHLRRFASNGLPQMSSHPPSRNPVVSTTSVSPSHLPTE